MGKMTVSLYEIVYFKFDLYSLQDGGNACTFCRGKIAGYIYADSTGTCSAGTWNSSPVG